MEQWKHHLARGLAGIVAVIALAVMLGWVAHITLLVQILPSLVPMQFNTALYFFLIALTILMPFHHYKVSGLLILLVMTIALATLFEYVSGYDVGIDELWITHFITTFTAYPGRMAPNTAVCFSLISIALLTLRHTEQQKLRRVLCLIGTLTVGILTLIALILGYGFAMKFAFAWGDITGMALHTSLCFFLLTIAVILNLPLQRSFELFSIILIAALISWFVSVP